MQISIRDYIVDNFKNSPIDEIEASINSSIESNEEVVLPGLGVFFEILWNNSDKNNKDFILSVLKNNL